MNSKNTKHRHISLTGTDYCDSKLSKKLKFEKNLVFQYSRKSTKNQSSKVVFSKVFFQPGTVLYGLRYNKSYDRCLVHSVSNGAETLSYLKLKAWLASFKAVSFILKCSLKN